MQLRRQMHHAFVRVLPAFRRLVVQEGFHLRDFMLLPLAGRLRDLALTRLGGRVGAHGLCQSFDENRLVLGERVADHNEAKRCVQRCRPT